MDSMWVGGMTFMATLFYSDSGDWGLENKSSTDSSIAEVLLRCAQLLLQYSSQWKTSFQIGYKMAYKNIA